MVLCVITDLLCETSHNVILTHEPLESPPQGLGLTPHLGTFEEPSSNRRESGPLLYIGPSLVRSSNSTKSLPTILKGPALYLCVSVPDTEPLRTRGSGGRTLTPYTSPLRLSGSLSESLPPLPYLVPKKSGSIHQTQTKLLSNLDECQKFVFTYSIILTSKFSVSRIKINFGTKEFYE